MASQWINLQPLCHLVTLELRDWNGRPLTVHHLMKHLDGRNMLSIKVKGKLTLNLNPKKMSGSLTLNTKDWMLEDDYMEKDHVVLLLDDCLISDDVELIKLKLKFQSQQENMTKWLNRRHHHVGFLPIEFRNDKQILSDKNY